MIVAGCSDSSVATTTTRAAPSTTTQATTTQPAATVRPSTTEVPPTTVVPEQLSDFELGTVLLDGISYDVALADTGDLRRRGLMGVTDLGSLDGMLFVFSGDTTGGFWMKDTLISLDIAFFTAEGSFVDGFVMEPCITEDCPTYRPSGPYRFALEMPAGSMPQSIERLEL